ncbi:unnamed protein product [Peronospora belbahrii]|uniref:Uncharacterized protein n=1 Tax=Peronospora belbahrii TaxID=622444 RepID=A0AAU9KVJ0_9STRA|nr:unnamed protein product [Peronospora belbahrii]CAH0519697.1 unnamed protein product [Peronospora belbahrii]
MEGETPILPTDFLQDLDLWLLQDVPMSPTIHTQSINEEEGNAGVLSNETVFLTPTAPVTDTEKIEADSGFVAALEEDVLPWADLAAVSPVTGESVTLTRPVLKSLMPQSVEKASETNTAQTRKGRPPASSKTTLLEPPMKKGKKNKSTSQRQKEELTYLREKSEQLEVELMSIKQRNREEVEQQQQNKEEEARSGGFETSTAMITRKLKDLGGPMQPGVSLWERIAKRQREEKAKSELENLKLREMVQGQMRLAKSLERLIRKRKIWDQLQGNSSTQDSREGMNEEETYEEMLREVDAQYSHVNAELRGHGVGESDPAVDSNVRDDAKMNYSPADGMFFEHKEKKFMPFDYLLLDKVMWRSFGEGKLKHEDTQLTILKKKADMVLAKAVRPLRRKDENKDVGFSIETSVIKRFSEGDRVVFVWFSKTNAKRLQDKTVSPVLLVHKGWGAIEAAILPDGSHGSVIRSYTRSVPTFSSQLLGEESGQKDTEHREAGLLTEAVFAAYQQSRQSVNQIIENLLLDEMMTKNATLTPATSRTDTNVSLLM